MAGKLTIFLLVAMLAVSALASIDFMKPFKCTEPNQEYTSCGSACVDRCGVPKADFCTYQCIVGCQCMRGYYLNSKNECVLPEDC